MFLIEIIRTQFIKWLRVEVEPPRPLRLSDFERLRHKIIPGDLLLIEGRSRISQIIRMVTHSNWSHACLYIGCLTDITDPVIQEKIRQNYHFKPDTQLVVESLLGEGIIVSPLTKYHKEHLRICRPHGLSQQDAQEVIAFTINRLGLEYDLRQIVDLGRFLLPWPIIPRCWRSTLFHYKPGQITKESCSSLLAEAFESVNFPILPLIKYNHHDVEFVQRNPRLFTPSDFDFSPFFDIIKYPIIEIPENSELYRRLPWVKSGMTYDDINTSRAGNFSD